MNERSYYYLKSLLFIDGLTDVAKIREKKLRTFYSQKTYLSIPMTLQSVNSVFPWIFIQHSPSEVQLPSVSLSLTNTDSFGIPFWARALDWFGAWLANQDTSQLVS